MDFWGGMDGQIVGMDGWIVGMRMDGFLGWMAGCAACPHWSTAAGPGCFSRAFLASPLLSLNLLLEFCCSKAFPSCSPLELLPGVLVAWPGSALPLSPGSL